MSKTLTPSGLDRVGKMRDDAIRLRERSRGEIKKYERIRRTSFRQRAAIKYAARSFGAWIKKPFGH